MNGNSWEPRIEVTPWINLSSRYQRQFANAVIPLVGDVEIAGPPSPEKSCSPFPSTVSMVYWGID